MISDFIVTHGLSVITQITSGHRCKHIYRVKDDSGRLLVLKIAEDDEGKEEIRKNLEGYKKLTLLGLEYFIPAIISDSLDDKGGHILMEDCGTDLATLLRNNQIKAGTRDCFEAEVSKIYAVSLGSGPDSNRHIDFQTKTVRKLYQEFFQAKFGSLELNDAIEKLREFLPRQVTKFCFSSWDFMPSNIFFSDTGIKFVDPTESVTGVPILDLACFSGVLEDVYNYPEARQWYECLKNFSLGPLAEMFSLTDKEAKQIYLLGRLVQTLLNFRVLIQRGSTDNTIFVSRIRRYIKQLIFLKR